MKGGIGGGMGGGGGDVITFVGTCRALREPIVHAAAYVGGEWGGGDVITFVGRRRALREPIVHAAAHVGGGGREGGGGCKYVCCRVTMHLDYVLLLKVEGHFLLCRTFTQAAKGNPCRNWYINARANIYIYIYLYLYMYTSINILWPIRMSILNMGSLPVS